MREFKPGLWRHYKGGLYTAIGLVTHHETRKPMVLYVSHTYGATNVRPLHGWTDEHPFSGGDPKDPDGWLDFVPMPEEPVLKVARFEFIGDLPSDTKITERRPQR